MSKKSLKQRQVEALEAIAKALEQTATTASSCSDTRDTDEWGYPRRYSDSGW